MARQQGISTITLGSTAQRSRIAAIKIRRRGHNLLVQVRQWQAQRQASMLGRTLQRLGTDLTIAHQA
ncbi:hypothetical protein D3C80_1358840 [compost metagenome]